MNEKRRSICLAVVAMLLLLSLAPSAHAWGPTGHRVVAEIAQRHLTPAAHWKVRQLLGDRTLADVANWPDELRSDPRFDKYKLLHFATVPNGVASYRNAVKDPCGDLVVAIDAFAAFLSTGKREALFSVKALTDKSDGTAKGACNPQETDAITPDTALRFLVHLMGDLHQPLHVGGTDLGGNKVTVDWMDRWKTNLHSTWDDEMVDYERLDYSEYARFLDRASEADAARWLTGDTISYADEAVAMRSKLYVFPDDPATPPVVHKISYKYIGAHRDRMREQLLKGGLRLAGVLNKIFK
jgi:nuclease S1